MLIDATRSFSLYMRDNSPIVRGEKKNGKEMRGDKSKSRAMTMAGTQGRNREE